MYGPLEHYYLHNIKQRASFLILRCLGPLNPQLNPLEKSRDSFFILKKIGRYFITLGKILRFNFYPEITKSLGKILRLLFYPLKKIGFFITLGKILKFFFVLGKILRFLFCPWKNPQTPSFVLKNRQIHHHPRKNPQTPS